MIQPLLVILICLLFAYILSELSKRLGLPRVVGQIAAGLILSIAIIKSFLFSVESLAILSFLANLGIILLFYYVGLETNFKVFTKNIKSSVIISVFNTLLPLILGFVLMRYFFNFEILPSLIVGISLSVSAQSVSIDILDELKLLKTKLGNMIVSAGAVDDTLELILVTMLLAVFNTAVSNLTITRLIIDSSIFILFIVFARLFLIPYSLKLFDREKSSTSRFMGSMIIVLLIASLSDFLGIGVFIGAIIAGVIVRQTIFKEVTIPNWEQHDIAKSTHIIAFGFLIPLFFVFVGVNTAINLILPNLMWIALFICIATVGTVGGTILAVKLNKGSFKEGMLLGWGLNPKGDIELAIIAMALNFSIITQSIYTSLVVMVLFTTIISPVIFKYLVKKYNVKKMKFGEVIKLN
ncbi:MAG: cation:proton antiporter [Nanoarchaeota archaeon]|nr:cation:proton antiporter [Nanoarchaeota archaeon]